MSRSWLWGVAIGLAILAVGITMGKILAERTYRQVPASVVNTPTSGPCDLTGGVFRLGC